MKTCNLCSEQYDPSSVKSKRPYCRPCLKELNREYRAKNPEAFKRSRAAYVARNHEKIKAEKRERHKREREDPVYREKKWLKAIVKSYGTTKEEYASILNFQGSVCAICGKDESSNRKNRLSVDHDHDTNIIRGLLCQNCNLGLGNFYDNIDNLSSAIRYLERASGLKRIYLSGPITGMVDLNYPAFNSAAAELRKEYRVFNPVELFGGNPNLPRKEYMRKDINALLQCDAIAVLPGWQDSAGASLEVAIARELDLEFIELGVPVG